MERDTVYIPQQQNLYSNLLIILQAIKCYVTNTKCNHINCAQFINIFDHIRSCDKAEDCNYSQCISTVSYMKHYLNCLLDKCACSKFGVKSMNNEVFAAVKDTLLRNQFLIWRRKIKPFRPHLLWKISDELASFTKDPNSRDIIYRCISEFDEQNFEKAKGIIIYLTNFAKNANDILNKIQWKHFRNKNPNITYQHYIKQVDEEANIKKIFNYLKRYSTDVLHDKVRLNPVPVKKIEEVKTEYEVQVELESHSPTNSSSLTPPKSISSLKASPSVLLEEKLIKNEKIWTTTDIQDLFMSLHNKMCLEKDAEVFLYPVDWIALEIPDYPKIITHPMDLSTINTKLTTGEYEDPWDVIGDYWLMFNNAWIYNKRSSRVYKMCSSLAKTFEIEADALMRSIGLCCGRDYVYLPQVLICCTPQMCIVNRDAVYYSINNEEENGKRIVPELGCDKYVCCEKCYNESPNEDSVQLMVSESTSTLVSVNKSLFTKLKNNVKEKEECVQCKICQKKWHKVCAEHIDEIWGSGFYCPTCEPNRPFPKQKNVLISANLPQCNLSRHIEARIDAWRQKESQTIAKIIIRVLSISNKSAEIKPEMKRIFVENGEMPDSLPYKLKAIFAFQEQSDGSEICLFGMHTQEYGSDCPSPNTRRVYLAYLDSVHFFEPCNLRTEFYHRLLMAYLEYCRQLGFIFAHIWACPPGEGDDYIFHMHPPTQKLPKPKRLQEWYISMLDKAMKEGIVVDYADIFAYSYNSQLMSVSEMPYFEGDYWPNVIEDLLKEDSMQNVDSIVDDDSKIPEAVELFDNTNSKKRKLKKIPISNNSKRRRQSDLTDSCNDIMKRLFDLMERRKENFFVIRLHTQSDASKLSEMDDRDVMKFSDLMDGRDKFLSLSREKHLEFSSLRRAKFATLVLCYELHLELHHGVIYSCDNCDLMLDEVRFTCQVCEEFELCESCASKQSHPHKLQRIPSLESENNLHQNTSGAVLETSPVYDPAKMLNKQIDAIRLFEHASKCRDASCKTINCNRWKIFVSHYNDCVKNPGKSCSNCLKLSRLLNYHLKTCRNAECTLEICILKKQRSISQTRLFNLVSERRRMKSATANAMVPIQQQPQINLLMSNQIDANTYTSDLFAIRSFIDQMKQDSTLNEEDHQRRFYHFLNSNPRYKETWRYHNMQNQQRQQISHQSQNVQRFPSNTQIYPSQYYQAQSIQQGVQINPLSHQQQLIQQQPIHQTQPYYLIQTRQPINQSHQIYYPPNNNNIQFHQPHSTLINNTQFHNFNPS